MKVATVRAGLSRTFNLGDYNSVKIETSLEADLEEGDDAGVVLAQLFAAGRAELKQEYLVQKGKKQQATSQD